MEVDRTSPDGTATWHGHTRIDQSEPGESGPITTIDAHLIDKVIICCGWHRDRLYPKSFTVFLINTIAYVNCSQQLW